MSERSKEHASKACEGKILREFESRFIRELTKPKACKIALGFFNSPNFVSDCNPRELSLAFGVFEVV